MAAHQRPDVTSCGPLWAGPRCGMSLGCGRRWGHRDERRGSSASEVGSDDGIATTTTPTTTTTATTSTTTATTSTTKARAKNYKQATSFTKRLTSLVMSR